MAHSAYPELGDSAIDTLLDALEAIRRVPLPQDALLGPCTMNIGTISGGRAPNVIADAAKAEILVRLVGDPAPIRDAFARAVGNRAQLNEILCIPPIRFQTVDGMPTTVVSFTTDIPMFGKTWGEPLLLGPGSIHVAHTAEERIAKRELSEAVSACTRTLVRRLAGVNLAIVGYGKMGRLIEQLAPEYGFDVKLRLDIDNNANYEGMTKENFRGIDAAVEFSTPATALENIERLARLGVNVSDRHHRLVRRTRSRARGGRARRHGPRLEPEFFGGREHLLAARRRGGAAAGAPAGIRRVGLGNSSRHEKGRALRHAARARRAHEAERLRPARSTSSSSRAGTVPGTHEIGFDSAADTITIRHTARSREGFARGALRAARWVVGKKGFFDFREIVEPRLA